MKLKYKAQLKVQHWQYGKNKQKHVFAFMWLTGHGFFHSLTRTIKSIRTPNNHTINR